MRFGSRGENGTLFDGVIGKVARAVIPGLTHAEFERIINGKQGTLVTA